MHDPQAGTTLLFSSVHSHPGIRFAFQIESTGEEVGAYVAKGAIIRSLCHYLIERLPDEAMPKIWEHVHDTWSWHSRPSLPPPQEPRPVQQSLNRYFGVVNEPAFRIEEE